MNRWNYRIIKSFDPISQSPIFQVHEVYYNEQGEIECWNDGPVEPLGINPASLRNDIQAFLSAFRLPTLEIKFTAGKAKLVEEPSPYMSNDAHRDYAHKTARGSEYIDQILGNHLLLKKDPSLRKAYDNVHQALNKLHELANAQTIEPLKPQHKTQAMP